MSSTMLLLSLNHTRTKFVVEAEKEGLSRCVELDKSEECIKIHGRGGGTEGQRKTDVSTVSASSSCRRNLVARASGMNPTEKNGGRRFHTRLPLLPFLPLLFTIDMSLLPRERVVTHRMLRSLVSRSNLNIPPLRLRPLDAVLLASNA